MYQEVDI